jgi:hypothetical protein
MTAITKTEEEAMAISFPAPEAAGERLEPQAAARVEGSPLIAKAAHLFRRGYERVCSAIFDPDGDCMRF